MTMTEEDEFRAAHRELLEAIESLTPGQQEWLLVYLQTPKWRRPLWRFRNWLRRPRG